MLAAVPFFFLDSDDTSAKHVPHADWSVITAVELDDFVLAGCGAGAACAERVAWRDGESWSHPDKIDSADLSLE